MEPKELSPALLQPQVSVVATLGELRDTLQRTEDTWRCRNVSSDDDDLFTSLSRALAAYESTPGTTGDLLTMADRRCQGLVSVLRDRCGELFREATQLHNTFREEATEMADMVATAIPQELQDEAALYGTALKQCVELGQALGREEGAEVVAGHEAQKRRDARVAAREATRATMERQRLEAALGLLERLMAACDKATAFLRELQRRVGDIEAALEVTNWVSPDVPEDLVAKVAVAEQLWETNAHLAKDHLLGAIEDVLDLYSKGDPASHSACGEAERCHRAIEDIPRLLRPPECPQSIPKICPVSPQQLQALVAVVATLGTVAAAVTWPHWDKSPNSQGPEEIHPEPPCDPEPGDVTSLGHPDVTSLGHPGVPSIVGS